MIEYTDHQRRYFAEQLMLKRPQSSMDSLVSAMSGTKVDLNPHQVDAALFALKSPLSSGALLADEVGLENLIDAGKIVTCSEIAVELHDNDVTSWLSSAHCVIIPIDDEIQRNVIKVVTTYPRLVDIGRNKSSGDPFLIATAMKYDLTVITEEGKDSPRKIPQVCGCMGIDCININELCLREGWIF